MNSGQNEDSKKAIHITGYTACPVKQDDGSWTAVLEPYEEDIPDLGREALICNKCGWPDYPKCKDTWCKAWVFHTKDEINNPEDNK